MDRNESDPRTAGGDRPASRAARSPSASAIVISRFLMRMLILGVFASIGTRGFARTFEALLGLAVLYCGISGLVRREKPLGPALTHFDEGAAYALCASLIAFAT